jgi:hypothetical protein
MIPKGLKFHECEEKVNWGLLQVPDQGRHVLLEAVERVALPIAVLPPHPPKNNC